MLLTAALFFFSAGARAADAPGADAFVVPACSTAAAAGWAAVDTPWLKARAPKAWAVSDALSRWEPAPSTSVYRRVVVDLDWSLKASTRPALSMFGMLARGTAPAAGAWLDETLAYARERGDYALGAAGTVPVPGRGECALGVVERNARGACGAAPVCRRAALHLDCGAAGGTQFVVTALTPGYPERGKPDGKAAAALADIKAFLCTLEFKGR